MIYFKKWWLGGKSSLRITSLMGRRWGRMHYGLDIGVPSGTVIKAPVSGTIVSCKVSANGFGLHLRLRYYVDNSRYFDIIFAHLNSVIIRNGYVEAGTVIARTGGDVNDKPNCGKTTGPHLHLQINEQGVKPVNPAPFLVEQLTYKGKLYQAERADGMGTVDKIESASVYINVDVTDGVDENATEPKEETQNSYSVDGERLAPGIWQITKLVMDSSVRNRQIFDSSISSIIGPLGNFFDKVCQRPLVELMGDTYGDQYFFMVRKPPFDRENYMRMLSTACYEINEVEIISTDLGWATEGIYSWYQYIPSGMYANSNGENDYYYPAVFFPEYAAIWGSKDLSVQSQYVSFDFSGSSDLEGEADKEENTNRILRYCVSDLKYLIESNAYIPFTRSGTITLNGNRTLKRGILVKLPNGEVFHVDSVSNTYSVTDGSAIRTTVLNVSRGMFNDYIYGVKLNDNKPSENGEMGSSNRNTMSYFNVIDFGEDFDVSKITYKNWKEKLANWKVNVDVFAFFLKRSQLLSTYKQRV